MSFLQSLNYSSDKRSFLGTAGSMRNNGNVKMVRDMWDDKDVAVDRPSYKATVPLHGVVFLRVGK